VLLAFATLASIAACDSSTTPHHLKSGTTLPGEPAIRVRISRSADTVEFTGPARIQIHPLGRPNQKALYATPLTIELLGNQWHGAWSETPAPLRGTLVVQPLGPMPLVVNDTRYPGAIHLVPKALGPTVATRTTPTSNAAIPSPSQAAQPGDRFDVVNHVGIESYLPGVLDRELYDDWKPSAYLAQAIAARSYAIDRIITHGPGKHYDVENTQASQAYGGTSDNPLAVRAVKDTAGMVLTWNDRIITAYYSSTCGGVPQSPEHAFARPGKNIPPLMPHKEHPWCRGTRYHSWGPIERDRGTLSGRVAKWGAARGKPIKHLGVITAIQPAIRNPLGRTVAYRVTDHLRKTYTISAEDLRHAANYHSDARKIAAPPRKTRILSSHFEVTVAKKHIIFSNGHGFGHGVGLCQYGAQSMATRGYKPFDILAEYYPGANVERAY